MRRVVVGLWLLWAVFVGAVSTLLAGVNYGGYDPTQHPPERVLEEALTVYWGNVARQQNGVPPLRWNRQLTLAARWYSWDSTENRPAGFCGHQDTLGTWPSDRTRAFGYKGLSGAENAFCGYLAPQDAINGWMNSPGHRANLLDPNSREVGIGYYRRDSDGRGYVTQDFGVDPGFAPVIIANEALTTTNRNVDVYVYQVQNQTGFAGIGPAVEMKIGEDVCLNDATWQPFASNVVWTLSATSGWKTVYAKTRDRFGRTRVVSDTIYLGTSVPLGTIDKMGPASNSPTVTIPFLDSQGFPYVELSLGWLADDSYSTFALLWGNGERVNDPDAVGGTAFRLFPGSGESSAWVYDTSFYKGIPMVAYVRLKVNDNTSSDEVARFQISGGGTTYGPLRIRGTDFTAPNTYQEFRLPFTFHDNPNDPFLIFQFWRSGTADVYVDVVTIFTAPRPATAPLVWTVPDENYRGQGVWGRFSDGASTFTDIVELPTVRPSLSAWPETLTVMASHEVPPLPVRISILETCGPIAWRVETNATWLQATKKDKEVEFSFDISMLALGTHSAALMLLPDDPGVLALKVPVTLILVDRLYRTFVPVVTVR